MNDTQFSSYQELINAIPKDKLDKIKNYGCDFFYAQSEQETNAAISKNSFPLGYSLKMFYEYMVDIFILEFSQSAIAHSRDIVEAIENIFDQTEKFAKDIAERPLDASDRKAMFNAINTMKQDLGMYLCDNNKALV